MFQPNSIKTLLSMKSYNQIENIGNWEDDKEFNLLKLSENAEDILGRGYNDPYQRIIDTKNLLKGCSSILQIFKDDRN